MKQFNLDEYLKNPSMKVVTRDGRNVKILCTNLYSACPVIAEIEGSEYSYSFYPDGKFRKIGNKYHENDLFFATEKHEGWANIYRDLEIGGMCCRCVFDSEEEAIWHRNTTAIATVKIEWED